MLAAMLTGGALVADEGMWLFNRLPLETLKERHAFQPPPGWVERLQRSAVRLSSGGSGSIVSPHGLVMTNHHVGVDALQKLSTAERNLVEDGFVATRREDELPCSDLEVVVLDSIEDVTARVEQAAAGAADLSLRSRARRAEIATIEKESQDSTSLHSEVVTLYQGGAYHLYRYRRYEDVRLVMAPEVDVAFFGGDADNFEFPRYCLDVCFFRIYEDGEPLKADAFLPWSRTPVVAGDLVFVAGHPGRTERLKTVDHLRYLRDVVYPGLLQVLARKEIALQQFSLESPEAKRMARDNLFGVQNGRKALRGLLGGLLDPALLAAKEREEAALRAFVGTHPESGASLDDWERIRSSLTGFLPVRDRYLLLEGRRGFWSTLFRIAHSLVRSAEEREKPNAQRLQGYRDSELASLKLRLFSSAPIYPAMEKAQLEDSLTLLATTLGADDPLSRVVLAGKSPAARAAELVSGTELPDVARRRAITEGGKEAIENSTDPMILLARSIDPHARALRRQYEDLVQGVQRESYGRLAAARFALHGTSVYPDATFSLRLAFGTVKGWQEDGHQVPFATTLGELFEKHAAHNGADPYELPARWLEARDRVGATVPVNFVATPDIIGGNSGSPVVNRAGEIVGLIFDGNIDSLVLDLAYTDSRARAVSVSASAILEALGVVYGQKRLVAEILEGKP